MASGKWALITGASAGIGWELAKLFAKDGHSVVLVARRREKLEALAQELKSTGVAVEIIDADLSKIGAVDKIKSHLDSKNISIEFLVNNAGVGTNGLFHKANLESELAMIDLNVRSLVELTGAIVPSMVARGSGKILNVGSTAGFQPGPYMAVYYASKAFVNSFSEALTEELKSSGISVTVLAPGPVATEFFSTKEMTKTSSIKLLSAGIATPQNVAEYGYRSMMKGKAVAVHGFKFKILLQSLRVSPRFLVRKLTGMLNRG